jgi:hypothetical protein
MKRILASTAGLLIAAGGSVMAAPPATAAPLVTGGLVNVTVTDVIDGGVVRDVNVGLGAALGIAANVCDVNVNVLARQLRTGGATCTSDASGQTATIDQV